MNSSSSHAPKANRLHQLDSGCPSQEPIKDCFHDHRGPPFDLQSHAASLQQARFTTNAQGIVDQPGLVVRQLPRPPIPVETLDGLDPFDDMLTFQPPPDLRSLRDARIPKDGIDFGSNHNLDFEDYALESESQRRVDYRKTWLPLIFTEPDEALAIPAMPKREKSEIDARVRQERLTITPRSSALQKEVVHLTDKPFHQL